MMEYVSKPRDVLDIIILIYINIYYIWYKNKHVFPETEAATGGVL